MLYKNVLDPKNLKLCFLSLLIEGLLWAAARSVGFTTIIRLQIVVLE